MDNENNIQVQQIESNQVIDKNKVSQALVAVGWVVIAIGALNVMVENFHHQWDFLFSLGVGILGLLLIGFGEFLRILHEINIKMGRAKE